MSSSHFLNLTEYTKIEKIGKGSFGEVYRVRCNKTNNIYAAKISIQEIDENSKPMLIAISREVNIFLQMNHPAILRFIGYSPTNFNDESYPVIITEYAPNDSLGNIINLSRRGLSPKTWNSTKKLINIYGIASGMHYLHLNNIIHRDLKPDNILMDDYLFPKIADFGLSKINHTNDKSITIQSTAGIKGTPIYIAPEIWKNEEYDKSGDVYSFGIIVYEIMTDEIPFKDFNQFQILTEVVFKKYRPELNCTIPNCYRQLIESCWNDNPKERPDFGQIIDELKNNPDFITSDIEKDVFLSYVEFIDQYKSTFNSNKKIIQIDDLIRKRRSSLTFNKTSVNQVQTKIIEEEKVEEEIIEEKHEEEIKYVEKHEEEKDEEKHEEIKHEEKVGLFKSIFGRFLKQPEQQNNQINIKYPVDEFNKLNQKCQNLVLKASDDCDIQFIVGRNLINGEDGFPQNIEIGVKYLEKSISYQCIDSLIYYCQMLIKGDIIPSDIEKAKKYLQRSFKENDGRVFLLYGKICHHEKNFSEARKFFEKSAKIGNPESMYKYGKALFKGEGVKMNINEALKYFDMSKRNGFEKSKIFLNVLHQLSSKEGFNKLHGATQNFFISEFIKNNPNDIIDFEKDQNQPSFQLKKIFFQSDITQMLYFNNSFKSPDFTSYLSNYRDISIEMKYPSKYFESQLNSISKIKQGKMERIKVIVNISGIKEFKYKFGLNNIINIISIDSSVTLIGASTFNGCQLLTEISIPESVNSIGASAFCGCKLLSKIIIPSSVVSIGMSAFKDCSSLYEIALSPSLMMIEKEVFYECNTLLEITIPSSVTLIGDNAFNGCSSLKKINIPSSVTSIGCYAFYGCTSLTEIDISSFVTSIGECAFRLCSSLKEISIPCFVSSIKDFTFYGCTSLEKISIPSSIKSIGECAFLKCSSLLSINIPSSVNRIGDSTFYECTSLKDVVIPSSITSIGERAFYNCSSIVEISIPSSVTSIGKSSFEGCSSMQKISIPSSIKSIECFGISDSTEIVRI